MNLGTKLKCFRESFFIKGVTILRGGASAILRIHIIAAHFVT